MLGRLHSSDLVWLCYTLCCLQTWLIVQVFGTARGKATDIQDHEIQETRKGVHEAGIDMDVRRRCELT